MSLEDDRLHLHMQIELIYLDSILPIALYRHEIRSLKLREERRYLRKGSWGQYLGPKSIRMWSGQGFRMRNLYNFYRSPNIVRMTESKRLRRWPGHRLEMPIQRLEENIITDLREITRNWIYLTQHKDLLENPCKFGI